MDTQTKNLIAYLITPGNVGTNHNLYDVLENYACDNNLYSEHDPSELQCETLHNSNGYDSLSEHDKLLFTLVHLTVKD